MKKLRFFAIALCVVAMLGNVKAFAAGITAQLSKNNIYVGSQSVQMTAYVIGGNNYVRLRDIGKAVDFSVFYDASTNSVRINGNYPYVQEENEKPPVAPATASAETSTQKIYVNGKLITMTAYSINGNNYVKLRDIGQALNFSVTYIGATNSVVIDKSLPYGTDTTIKPAPVTPSTVKTAITEKTVDGKDHSREDFSQAANPAIFTGVYTRGAYNAIRQTIVDRATILADNNSDGFNPYYSYANFVDKNFDPNATDTAVQAMITVASYISEGNYLYSLGVEPYVKNYYAYPGYSICKVKTNPAVADANTATDSFISTLTGKSDREKVIAIADYLCDRLSYGDEIRQNGRFADAFTSDRPIKQLCGGYASYFSYLCESANIPSVGIIDADHGWNSVYVGGKWLIVDVTNYDTARSMTWMLTESYPKQDINPSRTLFIKELLVPGSTK